jgi:hypothetical protein
MGLRTAIKRWQSNWMSAQELDSVDQDQRDALARDIGISAEMLPILVARGPEVAELPRLIHVLALDSDRIRHVHATMMRDMSLTCSGGTAAIRCRHDLDQGRARTRYGEYCPNAETLQELQGKSAPKPAHS